MSKTGIDIPNMSPVWEEAMTGWQDSLADSLIGLFAREQRMPSLLSSSFTQATQPASPLTGNLNSQGGLELERALEGQNPRDVAALHQALNPDIKVVTAPQAQVADKQIEQKHTDVSTNVEELENSIAQSVDLAREMDAKNALPDQNTSNDQTGQKTTSATGQLLQDAAVTGLVGAVTGSPLAAAAAGFALQANRVLNNDANGQGTLKTINDPLSSTPRYVRKNESRDPGYQASTSAPDPVQYNNPAGQFAPRPTPVFSPTRTPLDTTRVALAQEGMDSIEKCLLQSEQMQALKESLGHYARLENALNKRAVEGVRFNPDNLAAAAEINPERATETLTKAFASGIPRNIMGV